MAPNSHFNNEKAMIVHLTPGATPGTHLPKAPFAESNKMSHAQRCSPASYESQEMQQGDVALFFANVVHFGPATKACASPAITDELDVTRWRWVLFMTFSPEAGPNQDAEQEFCLC